MPVRYVAALCNSVPDACLCGKMRRRPTVTRQVISWITPHETRHAVHGVMGTVALLALFLFTVPGLRAQGPPFQTDDPVPVDLHHYEFYIFGGMDGTTAEIDSSGPAFEFNWGAIPRVQLHAILPLGVVAPSNNPIYLPGGTGAKAFGLTDMELGAKIAFIKETKYVPQLGNLHDVRNSNWKLLKRSRCRQSLVQSPPLAAKEYRPLDLGRRRRISGGSTNRLPQLSVYGVAGETNPRPQAGVGSRAFRPCAGGLRRATDRGFDDDRPGRLLSLQASRRSAVLVRLRTLHRRTN